MYIEELLKQSRYIPPMGMDLGVPQGQAYSSYFPLWETQTPQYVQPSIYQTVQSTFRTNEFVYSIIIKRALAEAKGHFRVNDNTGEQIKEINNHELTKLIRHPNKNMTENDFWGIKRISQDLAGFSAWEIEYNVLGEPMRLWFMRPDWCSFRRGQQDPLQYIRYQPWGLPFMDIPLVDPKTGQQKILFFSNAEDFDPIFPGVRFFSPAMHCLSQIESDNAATFFLRDFWEHGTHIPGILSVQQTVDENVAQDYQRRWMETHGGVGGFNKPVVLGLGTTWIPTSMSFKDMAFSELDARTETRICNTFQIETIVADARAGLDVSSYNNKKEAVKDWYYGWVTDTWATNAEVMITQMLPIYEEDTTQFLCDYDVSNVYAMQEDRTAKWTRAVSAWEKRLVVRNVALEEAGLDPVEGSEGQDYYIQATIRDQQTLTPEGDITETPEGSPVTNSLTNPTENQTQAETDAKMLEKKNFKQHMKGKDSDKPFEWKHNSISEQIKIEDEIESDARMKEFAAAINKAVDAQVV